jgi:hypothetical protein
MGRLNHFLSETFFEVFRNSNFLLYSNREFCPD